MNLEETKNEIISRLEKSPEWLFVNQAGKTFALKKDEIEIEIEREKILLSFQSAEGFQTWRIADCIFDKQKILLDLSRNFGTEKIKVAFIPRTLSNELSETVELARLEKANKIARQFVETNPKIKLTRVSLKHENGRLAHIFLEDRQDKAILALHDISDTIAPERILTTAILELEKLSRRKKKPIEKIWILAIKKTARTLQKILAMLKRHWQMRIEIFEVIADSNNSPNEDFKKLLPLSLSDLQHGKPSKISSIENNSLSETAQKIIDFAPDKIDAIFSKHGETLRFQGLPFVRLRKFAGVEKVWFGVENKRQILNEQTLPDFSESIENLKTHRRSDAPSKRHILYTLAPESWLEANLRRNIKQLDGNLILSPLHTQFRAGRGRVDLLALRTDSRLVIVELKTSKDREMIFQSLDYWQKIECERRTGKLEEAKIFGDKKIKDQSALIYLAAPIFEFHRDLEFLAQTITPEIEIYRFDLNQNWRENLQVLRQKKFALE